MHPPDLYSSYKEKKPCTLAFLLFHPPFLNPKFKVMSQHPSFKVGSSSGKKRRNVLKRFERINLLRKRGSWQDGDRVMGLVKTKPED